MKIYKWNYLKNKLIMFDPDFFPTPEKVIATMLNGYSLEGKTILEPSAGKGDIVDFCIGAGAFLIACEKQPELKKLLQTKCNVIEDDFLNLTSDKISHIDMIVMNPPFSKCEQHILHAFEIAPAGCEIISLCNSSMVDNRYSRIRHAVADIIETNGSYEELGDCFSTAERKTGVKVSLLRLKKPGTNYNSEFEGFFMEDDPEEVGENGLMPYNFVRDLVNRYVAAVKIFDQQLVWAVQMNNLTSSFFSSQLSFSCTNDQTPVHRNEFKKDLQKSAWKYVFKKMNMQKFTTKGLEKEINKFVEQQTAIPFTMKNIYRMIEIVIGTHKERMDKAILEVFDRITYYHADNRYHVEGWKTNSHYLIGQKFIMPYIAESDYSGGMKCTHHDISHIDDMVKALCFITGQNYDNYESLWHFMNCKVMAESGYPRNYVKYEWNTWYDWGFFEIKGFKKGTMHFKFKDLDVWAKFNQHVSRLKGYPLFEGKEETEYQKRNNGKNNKKEAA